MNTMCFINAIHERDFAELLSQLEYVFYAWFILLIAIAIDLYFGVKKAKSAGEMRTSYGYRQTGKKIIEYYTVLVYALLIDFLASCKLDFVWFTYFAVFAYCFVELKSVYEKKEDKDKKRHREAMKYMSELMKRKEDLPNGIAELLDKEYKKGEDK